RSPVAERRRHLARLVEAREGLVQAARLFEGEHRRLPARDDDRVVVVRRKRRNGLRVVDQADEARGRQEPHADQIARRISGWIARVAERVGLALAAVWREDVDPIALLGEGVPRMAELAPPEADRP